MRRPRRWRRLMKRYKPYCLIAAFYACILIFGVCAFQLIRYGVDWVRSRAESKKLAEAYYTTAQPWKTASAPALSSIDAPSSTPLPPEAETIAPSPAASPTPASLLTARRYPHNPYREVNARFTKLHHQNKDIVGWLHVDDVLDEAIVQRDNEYYLRRDYRGYHNSNGALFLDESCDLDYRPYVYMIYGHNMKTGAMFGCLRNWENSNFYHNNPFIQFDTMYEDGQYVVFSVGIMSKSMLIDGLLMYSYKDMSYIQRQLTDFIDMLERRSIYTNHISVTNEDQLLLLVTCTDNENERRVIAARRVRDGESLEDLKNLVSKNKTK